MTPPDVGRPAVRYVISEPPDPAALDALWRAAWGEPAYADPHAILARSLCFVCAYAGEALVGFVNVAWDGGAHASVFDTCVHPAHRRKGVGTALVRRAAAEATRRGAAWLHVDFEPHLTDFYRRCGFRPTAAGLLRLSDDGQSAANDDLTE